MALPVFANAGNYEYNSYVLHVLGGNVVKSGAFWSDTPNMSSFNIYIDTSNGYWRIDGSTYASPVPTPNGYELGELVDNTYYAEINGTKYYFNHITQSNEYVARNIPTANYPTIQIYLPFVEEGTGGGGGSNTPVEIPTTPILSIINDVSVGSLYWTPQGYPAKILYLGTDGQGLADVEADNVTTVNYIVTKEGYYRVQLHYTVDGEDRLTDTSNKVQFVKEDAYDDSILGKIHKLLADIIDGLDNAVSTIGQFISNIGNFIKSLIGWLPDQVQAVFFAVVIIGLVLGLFLK